MHSIVNLMGTLTVGLCAFLLLRAYTRVRKRLLLWSGMCFAGLTVANALLIIDLALFPAEASSYTRRARATASAGVGGGSPVPVRISREAVSRNIPVGLPDASLRKSPPAGFGVAPSTSDSCIALALAKLAWPLACVRKTGLFGETAVNESWVGNPSTFGDGTAFHFSWCQPRP